MHYKLGAGFNWTDSVSLLANLTNDSVAGFPPMVRAPWWQDVRIPLYCLILLLSVTGNTLVIATLAQNARMRTVTNVFLLNLAVSDLLLAVLCMPFTLIPTLMQDFIFGKAMCVLIRYLQGVSVGVSVFTLVAISLERYFAICQPLRSRAWQTLSHAYLCIVLIWVLSLFVMVPIAVFQQHSPMMRERHKCREVWGSRRWEIAYTLLLDVLLLLAPLLLMLTAYGRISWTLWKGMRLEMRNAQELTSLRPGPADDDVDTDDDSRYGNGNYGDVRSGVAVTPQVEVCTTRGRSLVGGRRTLEQARLRQNNTERSLRAKKRVIRMLFVLVLEFFICWAPSYLLQTWSILDKSSAMQAVSSTTMNYMHLLSYVSACCNPLTYCFMNSRFRQGFLALFCCRRHRRPGAPWRQNTQHSEYSWANSGRTGNPTCGVQVRCRSPLQLLVSAKKIFTASS